jgi:16S rRNA U516 pseudouridylate synthase RsuA-like enzyme
MEREIVQWKKGIKLTDGMARADQIVRMGKTFRITLHQGKNRQIRRMAGKSGNKVETLTRTRSGDVTLGDLPAGKWKAITIKGEAQLSTKKAPAKVLSKSPCVATAARPAAKRVVRKPRA